MNCFQHQDRPAVGICKSCGKGLCVECAAAVPNGLACRNACEARVALINRIVDNNQKVIVAANTQIRTSGRFILALGILFIVLGLLPLILSGNTSALFMSAMGVFFAIYGLLRLVKRSQYYPATE